MSRRTAGWVLGVAAAGSLLIFAANFWRVGYGVFGDAVGYFAPLRSVVVDGNRVVEDELRHYVGAVNVGGDGGPRSWRGGVTRYAKYPPGTALLAAGPYALTHGVLLVGHALLPGAGVTWPAADGYTWPYELAYCLALHVLALAALGLVYLTCRRFVERGPATLATLGVAFASPVSYYLLIEPGQSHAASQAAVSGFVYVWARGGWRTSRRAAAGLGLLLAMATLVRYQNLLYGLVIPATAVLRVRLHEREELLAATAPPLENRPQPRAAPRPACLLVGTLVVAAVLAGQAAVLAVQREIVAGQSPDRVGAGYLAEAVAAPNVHRTATGFTPFDPAILGVLFDGQRPLFVWHPLTAVAVLGLLLLLRRRPRLALCLLLPLAAQVYLIASWQHGYQGAALGTRMLAGATPLFALGLALLYDRFMPPPPHRPRLHPRPTRFIPVALTALALVYQLSLTAEFMRGRFDNPRQPPLDTVRQVLHLD